MTRTLLLTVTIVAGLLVAVAFAQRSTSAKKEDAKIAWEYLVVAGGTRINTSSSGTSSSLTKLGLDSSFREQYVLEKNLDKLGLAGWELVSVTILPNTNEPLFHLKRQKEEQ